MAVERFWTPANLTPTNQHWIKDPWRSIPVNITPETFRAVVNNPDFQQRVTGGENVPVYQTHDGQRIVPTRLLTSSFPDLRRITPEEEARWPHILLSWFHPDYRSSLQGTVLPAGGIAVYLPELIEKIPEQYRNPNPHPHYAWTRYFIEGSMLREMDAMCVRWLQAEFYDRIEDAFRAQMAPLARKRSIRRRTIKDAKKP